MSQSLKAQVERAFNFAQDQVIALVERDPGFYPLYTDQGKWRHSKPAWTHWCDGFLPGMMWIFYEEIGEARWRELAENYSRTLEQRKDDREVHDLGFIFYHGTYKRWYEATVRDDAPDQSLKDVVIHAGQTLALRFNDLAGCLRSFHGSDSNFIDIMMNVGIIFYAALETNGGVEIGWARNHGQLDLWVNDEGPGLASTANLFVPFFTTKAKGSGIGLVLSRQIAEAHGGTLSLENRGTVRGCEARLRLPLR